MYPNLNAELARCGISQRELASRIGRTPGTLSLKLTGKAVVTLPEAAKIKEIIGTTLPLEVLFATGPASNSA